MNNIEFLDYNLKLNQEYFLMSKENEWSLHRNKYVIYEVMNSKKNTKEELKKFVKEHHTYNYTIIAGLQAIIMSFALCIMGFINIKLNNKLLRYFILGALFYTLIEILVRSIVNAHNNKIKDKILKEDMSYFDKQKEKLSKKLKKAIESK